MKNILMALLLLLIFLPMVSTAQEMETLFGEGVDQRFVWSLDVRTMSVQQSIGTSIGWSGGMVFNETFIAGGTVAANLTHSTVNAAVAAAFVRYVHDPQKLVHPFAAVLLGSGTVKDYEQAKTNPFDNFGNVFGAGYYFIEPEIGYELNASNTAKVACSIGYRLVSGADPAHPSVVLYRPGNGDLSGFQFAVTLQFE